MSPIEKRILQNQFELLWGIHFLIGKICPDLVGRDGEVDKHRDEFRDAAIATRDLIQSEEKK